MFVLQFKLKCYDGYLEILLNEVFIDGVYVMWVVGYLCQFVSLEDYKLEWKKWLIDMLLMISDCF